MVWYQLVALIAEDLLVNFYQIQKEKRRKTRRIERRRHVTPVQHAYVESQYFIILDEVA